MILRFSPLSGIDFIFKLVSFMVAKWLQRFQQECLNPILLREKCFCTSSSSARGLGLVLITPSPTNSRRKPNADGLVSDLCGLITTARNLGFLMTRSFRIYFWGLRWVTTPLLKRRRNKHERITTVSSLGLNQTLSSLKGLHCVKIWRLENISLGYGHLLECEIQNVRFLSMI